MVKYVYDQIFEKLLVKVSKIGQFDDFYLKNNTFGI
jgi:hypothetical protein